MPFLLISVLCSVLVSVWLKLAQRRGIPMPPVILWNYVTALAMCLLWLHPPLQQLRDPHTPRWTLTLLAALLPTIFLAMAASVRIAGIARTDVAQRLSLVVSLGAAFLWFGERADGLKLAGLAIGLLAILCIVSRPRSAQPAPDRRAAWLLPLVVLLGYAGVDILLKRIAIDGTPFAASLTVAFLGALAIMTIIEVHRALRTHASFDPRALLAGVLVGASNFANIFFYVRAHRALPDHPAVVFASMNLGVVVIGTLVGVWAFKERPSRLNHAGIALAVIAMVTIALSLRG